MRYFIKQSSWMSVASDIAKSTINKDALVVPKALRGAAIGAVGGGVIGGASSGDFGGAMRGAVAGAALGGGAGAYVGKRLGNFYGNVGRLGIAGGAAAGAYKAFKNPAVNDFAKQFSGKIRGFTNAVNKGGIENGINYAKGFFNTQSKKFFQ